MRLTAVLLVLGIAAPLGCAAPGASSEPASTAASHDDGGLERQGSEAKGDSKSSELDEDHPEPGGYGPMVLWRCTVCGEEGGSPEQLRPDC